MPIQTTSCTPGLCPGRLHSGKAHLAVLSLVALLSGCASESTLLKADPGFTADALRSGRLAVLGVVQVDEVAQARPALIAALERVLSGARKDVPLVPADRVRAALGDSAMRLFLLGYQLRGDPDSVWLARAAGAASGLARYGVLARVEAASVRYGTQTVSSPDPLRVDDREIRVTGRDAHVEVTVYDLEKARVVYRAKFFGAADAAPELRPLPADSADVSTPAGREGRPVRSGRIGYPIPGPGESPSELGYPDPPPVARAAENAFLSFARSLPGSPSSP